jgi:hypothetical protein
MALNIKNNYEVREVLTGKLSTTGHCKPLFLSEGVF